MLEVVGMFQNGGKLFLFFLVYQHILKNFVIMSTSACVLPDHYAADLGLSKASCSRLIQILVYRGWSISKALLREVVAAFRRCDQLNLDCVCLSLILR